MSRQTIELANVIIWDRNADDKVYVEEVGIAIEQFPFTNRQVFVRFAEGPALDLSIWDMDRLVAAYQSLRQSASLTQVMTSSATHRASATKSVMSTKSMMSTKSLLTPTY